LNIWDNQYRKLGFAAQRLYPNEELLRFLGRNYFRLNKPERKKLKILELGCGSGANLWMMAKEGFTVSGVDNSSEGLELCTKMLEHWGVGSELSKGNIINLPYENNSFDSVVDVVSMQHLSFSEHTKAYAEIKRVLKPHGLFFSYHLGSKSYSYTPGGGRRIDKYTVDNISNPKAPLSNNGTTCFPTERSIEKILLSKGFRNISIENVIKTYQNRSMSIQYLAIEAQSA
jgi:ubiquinone/menaquinone biosynthesis C-methylase UbiE